MFVIHIQIHYLPYMDFSAHGQTQVSKKYSHQGSSKCNNCSNYHRILSYFVNINIYWEHLFCTKSSQYWCQKMLEKFMMYPIHQSWLKLFIAWLGKLTMLNSVLYCQSQSRREHNCQVLFPFRSILYCIHNWMNWIWSIFPMPIYTYSTRYSKLELTLFI